MKEVPWWHLASVTCAEKDQKLLNQGHWEDLASGSCHIKESPHGGGIVEAFPPSVKQ